MKCSGKQNMNDILTDRYPYKHISTILFMPGPSAINEGSICTSIRHLSPWKEQIERSLYYFNLKTA